MAEPFIGEIKMFAFNFPPKNWALCNGALIAINQNQALYSLLGIQFGGDGRTNFKLPDLRGRVPLHLDLSQGINVGTFAGAEDVTLDVLQLPTHTHTFNASDDAATDSNISVDGTTTYAVADGTFYTAATNLTRQADQTCSSVGGGQAHENRQPSLTVNFSIALMGLYPSRN